MDHVFIHVVFAEGEGEKKQILVYFTKNFMVAPKTFYESYL